MTLPGECHSQGGYDPCSAGMTTHQDQGRAAGWYRDGTPGDLGSVVLLCPDDLKLNVLGKVVMLCLHDDPTDS